jgi:DnaJ-class molecular chaperone|tara:strand:- start:99 stop:257 length:159 start_codon:yes stop_codon:yes gene_type:complete
MICIKCNGNFLKSGKYQKMCANCQKESQINGHKKAMITVSKKWKEYWTEKNK